MKAACVSRHAPAAPVDPWWWGSGSRLGRIGTLALLLALAACSTAPPSRSTAPAGSTGPVSRPRSPDADGPPPGPQGDPMQVADAVPQVEPIRPGGPNKPYEVAGQTYVPLVQDAPLVETGLASWYGSKFHGRRTASGEVYNMHAMTAAHKTMPIPSFARVRNPANGREVIVRVNDRGPFVAGRIIDLSYAAAMKLGTPSLAKVEVQRLTNDEIREMAAAGGDRVGVRVAAPAVPTQVAVAPVPAPVPAPLRGRAVQSTTGTARSVTASGADAVPSVAAERPGEAAAAAVTSAAPIVATALPAAEPPSPARTETVPAAAGGASSAELPGASPDRSRAYTPAAAGFWLQLGAFGRADGALGFHQKVSQELEWLAPLLAIYADGPLHRLQAGPYPSRDQAREAAERVRAALQLVPLVIERR